ncbi:olfactory receptor 24-like [Acanthaster planci]|uniref:Olfactory receptor 24-like n=1 Tax=Acanthaster planci TaxID=133434 RepID=A0A8B7Y2S6_ACAPL|nr:olfactory receptor 24-like [Acanthaster planci]
MESNTSGSPDTDHYPGSSPVAYGLLVTIIPCAVISLVIHLYIIFSVVFNSALHSASNYFLANLCASIAMSSALSAVLIIPQLLPTVRAYDDSVTTPSQTTSLVYVAVISVTVSFVCSCAIVAGDRYVKVAYPLRYLDLMTNKACGLLIGSCWVSSLVVSAGFGVSFGSKLQFTNTADFESLRQTPPYRIFTLFFTVIVCLGVLVITGFVVSLLRIARQQQRKIQHERNMLPNAGKNGVRQLRRGFSTTKGYIFYLGSFNLVWIPYAIGFNLLYCLQVELSLALNFVVVTMLLAYLQLMYGTLFLTFMQAEHRKVLRSTWTAVAQKLKR